MWAGLPNLILASTKRWVTRHRTSASRRQTADFERLTDGVDQCIDSAHFADGSASLRGGIVGGPASRLSIVGLSRGRGGDQMRLQSDGVAPAKLPLILAGSLTVVSALAAAVGWTDFRVAGVGAVLGAFALGLFLTYRRGLSRRLATAAVWFSTGAVVVCLVVAIGALRAGPPVRGVELQFAAGGTSPCAISYTVGDQSGEASWQFAEPWLISYQTPARSARLRAVARPEDRSVLRCRILVDGVQVVESEGVGEVECSFSD